MLSTNQDSILKPVLWFIHILAENCSNALFTLEDLSQKLGDIIKPIAEEKVRIVFNVMFSLSDNIFQYPLDYINGKFDPPLEDLKTLSEEFSGVRGTHLIAQRTLLLLNKYSVQKWTL